MIGEANHKPPSMILERSASTSMEQSSKENRPPSSIRINMEAELEKQYRVLIDWIQSLVPSSNIGTIAASSFIPMLRSGVILCNLINSISPGIVSQIHLEGTPQNIISYLKACETLGLEKGDMFTPSDIGIDAGAVSPLSIVKNIYALERAAARLPTYNGPRIARKFGQVSHPSISASAFQQRPSTPSPHPPYQTVNSQTQDLPQPITSIVVPSQTQTQTQTHIQTTLISSQVQPTQVPHSTSPPIQVSPLASVNVESTPPLNTEPQIAPSDVPSNIDANATPNLTPTPTPKENNDGAMNPSSDLSSPGNEMEPRLVNPLLISSSSAPALSLSHPPSSTPPSPLSNSSSSIRPSNHQFHSNIGSPTNMTSLSSPPSSPSSLSNSTNMLRPKPVPPPRRSFLKSGETAPPSPPISRTTTPSSLSTATPTSPLVQVVKEEPVTEIEPVKSVDDSEDSSDVEKASDDESGEVDLDGKITLAKQIAPPPPATSFLLYTSDDLESKMALSRPRYPSFKEVTEANVTLQNRFGALKGRVESMERMKFVLSAKLAELKGQSTNNGGGNTNAASNSPVPRRRSDSSRKKPMGAKPQNPPNPPNPPSPLSTSSSSVLPPDDASILASSEKANNRISQAIGSTSPVSGPARKDTPPSKHTPHSPSSPSLPSTTSPSSSSLNLPIEEGIIYSEYNGKIGIRGGAIPKLVDKLLGDDSALDYVSTFLFTYRTFMTPKELMTMIIQKRNNTSGSDDSPDRALHSSGSHLSLSSSFSSPFSLDPDQVGPSSGSSIVVDARKKVTLRVCNFLRRWVENFFHDFQGDSELIEAYSSFVETIRNGADGSLATILEKAMFKQAGNPTYSSKNGVQQQQFSFDKKAPTSILPKCSVISNLEDMHVTELARQLTLIGHDLYRRIPPKEFLSLSWQKPDKEVKSPNLLKMIRQFNLVSGWAISSLVKEPVLRKRVSRLKLFVKLIQELHKLNNFDGMFAVMSGLNAAPVHRLKKTWEASGKQKKFEEMMEINSSASSWKSYRGALHSVDPPCIPYTGVYLSDLTFVEEGNPTILENGFVNVFKMRKIAEVITEIHLYQQQPYNLKPVDNILQFLSSFEQPLDERTSFKLSLEVEPREG